MQLKKGFDFIVGRLLLDLFWDDDWMFVVFIEARKIIWYASNVLCIGMLYTALFTTRYSFFVYYIFTFMQLWGNLVSEVALSLLCSASSKYEQECHLKNNFVQLWGRRSQGSVIYIRIYELLLGAIAVASSYRHCDVSV